MKFAWKAVTLLVLALGLTAWLMAAPDPQAGSQTADAAAIGKLRDQYIAAANGGNADAIAALWTEDGVLMPPGQPAVVGRTAIRDWYRPADGRDGATITIRSEETQVFGPWGFDRGTFTLQAGDRSTENKYITVVRRDGDTWKVARNIWSPDTGSRAPAATPPPGGEVPKER